MRLSVIFAITSVLGSAAAVDLFTYKKPGCPQGSWLKCTNPAPGQCCRNSKLAATSSLRCEHCSKRHRIGGWSKSGDQACYRLTTSGEGGKCVSNSGAYFHGSRWIYADPGKKRDEEDAWKSDQECVDPDTVSIEGRVFKITDTTSDALKDELFDLFAQDDLEEKIARRSLVIPDYFKVIEITGTPEAAYPSDWA